MTTETDWKKLADNRLAQLNAIAQIGAEPADAVLAIIKGEEPDQPGTGTWNCETTAEFRRGLVAAATHHHKVADEYRAVWDMPRGERPRDAIDAHAGSLMAGSYAYTLAAILGYAERELGAETARRLADLADCILTNGDDDNLNADVKPGIPLPPPTPREQAAAGQLAFDAGQASAA